MRHIRSTKTTHRLAGLLVSLIAVIPSVEAGVPDAFREQVTLALKTELETSGIPSVQVAISHKGQMLFNDAQGKSDLENHVSATAQTRYRTASVSKWLTATAAMMLFEQGQLDLDQPVQTYCPQYPVKHKPLTSRQLLNHTGGVRHYQDYDKLMELADTQAKKQQITLKRLSESHSAFTRHTDVLTPLNAFKDDPLLFDPGSSWQYTSFGYRLLGCVIAGAANSAYSQFMEERIFAPSGMQSTTADDAWAIVPHRAQGYRLNRDKTLRRADLRDVSDNLPAGGHLSTAGDLVRFVNSWQGALISEASRHQMLPPAPAQSDTDADRSWRDLIPSADTYGYGVMQWSKYRPGMIGHTGRQAGTASIVVYLPGSDTAVAVMTNAKGWMGYLEFVMQLVEITESYIREEAG